ncbi:uncharacterized protein CIMG_07864 [Coccidioides immitis RS]|uniref:Uncharacterized protein n=4 Tax=Coccidioides immitis TaxID=5501 RepID=J3K4A6_COCIM|nr:uncharacterized protein CIMG_07864 [Coccidioides immitis RS]EAS29118.3 hypothetical protein CIMG_07864 [Coccidioides immitis RS]KMP06237.1 hypothetical protein CIRG_05919 [Coccidioides immitis RMSCC 2394]KMU80557.1 hypothetical protein CISG_02407 [Coccidioides immitis RMSCC 3703]KMU91284.1 hypothetical protein CIHG_09162 [Coccidioides immitis H538.4]
MSVRMVYFLLIKALQISTDEFQGDLKMLINRDILVGEGLGHYCRSGEEGNLPAKLEGQSGRKSARGLAMLKANVNGERKCAPVGNDRRIQTTKGTQRRPLEAEARNRRTRREEKGEKQPVLGTKEGEEIPENNLIKEAPKNGAYRSRDRAGYGGKK